MADLSKELEKLFVKTVEVMQAKLESGEADAATLGQIRQLLKDNNIESRPEAGNKGLLKLAQSLPFESEADVA